MKYKVDCISESIRNIKLKPVVIWGTKTAARICFLVLRKMNANIIAVGDNYINNSGNTLYNIPVLSLQQIQNMYSDVLVVIGSFSRNSCEAIITQIESTDKRFTICRFEEIEYLYELIYLKRNINDKEKLFNVINNIFYKEVQIWERKTNKNIAVEYRYVVHDDKAEDLKEILEYIYGIKRLVLIINADKIKRSEFLIDELTRYDNIGHIVVVLNYKNNIRQNDIKMLARKVFYIICDENTPKEFLVSLEKIGIAVDIKKVPDQLFDIDKLDAKNIVTEKNIVDSVLAYIDQKNIKNCRGLSSKPVYIVQLFNGLANQMLMYLFGKFVEEESGRLVIFDDTILSLEIEDEKENVDRVCMWNKSLTRSEIEKGVQLTRAKNSFYKFNRAEVAEVFDIPIRLLSDYFDEKTWRLYLEKVKGDHLHQYIQGYPLCHVLIQNGFSMTVFQDTVMPNEFFAVCRSCNIDVYSWGRPYTDKSITYFMLKHNNVYFMGAWATGKVDDWFIHNRQWVNQLFKFRLNLNELNQNYIREIRKSYSIIIHIRRGDFACFKIAADTEYYRRAIEQVETTTSYENQKYFVFSDDLDWCCEHKSELGIDKLNDKVVFVSGNTGTDSYMDLYLMSLGRIVIATPGSTFSYMAILLSQDIEKCVNIPKYVYELTHGMDAIPQLVDM